MKESKYIQVNTCTLVKKGHKIDTRMLWIHLHPAGTQMVNKVEFNHSRNGLSFQSTLLLHSQQRNSSILHKYGKNWKCNILISKNGEYVRHKQPIVPSMRVKQFHFCIRYTENTTCSPIKFTPIITVKWGKPERYYTGPVLHTAF